MLILASLTDATQPSADPVCLAVLAVYVCPLRLNGGPLSKGVFTMPLYCQCTMANCRAEQHSGGSCKVSVRVKEACWCCKQQAAIAAITTGCCVSVLVVAGMLFDLLIIAVVRWHPWPFGRPT